jgi:predicted PurR-regulated permease PerM
MPAPRADGPREITVSTSTFLKAVFIVLGLAFLWFVRDLVALVFIAILLAALIDPPADWFARHGVPRSLAVFGIYVILGALVVTAAVIIVPILIDQTVQLLANLPALSATFTDSFAHLRAFSVQYGFSDNLRASVQSLQDAVTGSFTSIFSTVQSVVAGIAALFAVLVLAFYMVAEEDTARKYFRHFAPVEYQPFLTQVLIKMQSRIGAWMRGQLILGLIVGTADFIGLSLIGVKYALLLGILAGILEIVPYLGPVLAVIPAAILGFAQSPVTGVLVLGLYLVVQQTEQNVLVPKIMQKVTGLNPIVSIVALLVGIKVGGLVGGVLAIPVATMLAVVLEELFGTDIV